MPHLVRRPAAWLGALVLSGLVGGWLLLAPAAARSGPDDAPQNDWGVATPASAGFDEARLQQTIRHLLDAPFNVHAVLIARHGRLLSESYRRGPDRSVYGVISLPHAFDAAQPHDVRSIGKSITSLLYGIALAEGRVPDPASPVLASYPALAHAVDPQASIIRIQHLLDMSSGLEWREGQPGHDDELRLFWKRDIPAFVLQRRVVSTPGTAFNYDGGGTAILADLITRGSGMPLDAYANARLFAPMGMQRWTWVRDLHGRPMAFNGLRMRPRDLLKIGQLVLDHGRWQGRQLVPAAWVERSLQPQLDTGIVDYRYGMQWWAGTVQWQGQTVDWHAGFGNGGQRLFVLPRLDLAIVITAEAYDKMPTAIAVNRFVQDVVSTLRE